MSKNDSKWFKLNKAHETRMWIKDIIVPVTTAVTLGLSGFVTTVIACVPESREWVAEKFRRLKSKFKKNN